MLVNHAHARGPIDRDQAKPADLVAEAAALAESGLTEAPGSAAFCLALRGYPDLETLVATPGRPVHDPSLPRLSESEEIRLRRKGRTLLDHCLDEGSRFCVTGFLAHESAKSPAGCRFALDFIAALLVERMKRDSAGERALIDQMIDEGIATLYGIEPKVEE